MAADDSVTEVPLHGGRDVIVRVLDDRIQLITQPDHAHLARTIMERCVGLAARPRRDAILLAIGEHDNGWDVEDAAPTVDPTTGAVVDFVNAPLRVRQTVWPRALARLAGEPWAAALVANHALIAYSRFRPDAEWGAFFTEMEAARGAILRAGGMPLGALVDDYSLVRLGDLISLAFCTGHTDAQRFDRWTIRLSGTRVAVAPDPFGGAEIPIAITAREIGNQPLRSEAELRRALNAAASTTLRGTVAGERG